MSDETVYVPNVREGATAGLPDPETGEHPILVRRVPRDSGEAGSMAGMSTGDDPGDFTVAEVNSYLGTLSGDDPERDRVVAAEKDGEGRVTIDGVRDGETSDTPSADEAAASVAPTEAVGGDTGDDGSGPQEGAQDVHHVNADDTASSEENTH